MYSVLAIIRLTYNCDKFCISLQKVLDLKVGK